MEKESVLNRIQPLVSSTDGELFDLSFNTDETRFEIIDLTHQEVKELFSLIEDQICLIKEAYFISEIEEE